MKVSNKIIVITQNKECEAIVEAIASQHQLIVEKNELLHSFDAIVHQIESSKSTAFLRSSLHTFIRQNGIPFFIVVDYPVAATTRNDAIVQKVFTTLLISFMIIAQGSGLANIKGNFFVNITHGDVQFFKSSIIHPEKLLTTIKTNDEKVNAIINHYADQKMFHALFFIKPCTFTKEAIAQELSAYIDAVKKRHALIEKLYEKQKFTHSRSKDAATVLVKISEDKIVLDHEIVITRDSSYNKYEIGHIYVLGEWTNIHSRKVAGKVITAIKDGFADWKLSNDDPVIIHLEEATVDHTTAATLAQIAFNELRSFTNIKIYCSERNYKILESADGFSLVKKLIFIQKA
ncbi:MAG: hypothetical protein N3F66_12215 [Spirochaetes bacterium]|nr:hypothetical protein [Spirochaetota bacterium]